ncbi:aspartic proteinase nepenthesin-1 [Prunus yedoensis var. nudiflora]|uniref:Aspartic proteinase nepenthesin-1 n=1 Tax=Prunus yedoensis var. nudiflora TaxID=2094558 RepID=A0A314ZCU5_PRUYE|nr:aspartic proteinase nepenthesin-1 [Prunus yedoensis var. nudiflora]
MQYSHILDTGHMTALSLFSTIFFFLNTIFILQSINSVSSSTAGDGFSVRLIHRDSPLSPSYNHSMTAYDRIQAAAYRSVLRLNHIHSLTTTFSSSEQDISSRIVPENGEYIVTFSVGTPPTQVHAFMDTGSEVIWVKCSQSSPVFNPAKSSSYGHHPCDSLACEALGVRRRTCAQFLDPCYYRVRYGDGSTTEGTLSHDKFAFEDPERNLVDVGHLDFGCSDYSSWHFVGNEAGALGLSRQPLSLISQLGIKKFSYCMVLPNNEGLGSRIYFGSEAVISGGQTPFLEGEDRYYYVTLIGIRIGDQNVPLPDGIFNRTSDGEGGFMIDSGTTYTFLRSEAYDALIKALSEAIDLPQRRGPSEWFELCFEGSFEDLESAAPDVTFIFDGAEVILMKQTTYIEAKKGLWCLAMVRSNEKLSIFGNVQQQNYFVGFDLEEQLVSFAPVDDCATF